VWSRSSESWVGCSDVNAQTVLFNRLHSQTERPGLNSWTRGACVRVERSMCHVSNAPAIASPLPVRMHMRAEGDIVHISTLSKALYAFKHFIRCTGMGLVAH